MSYVVPRDRPAECRKCPFCDIYTYDCRLQRVQYETFEEQIRGCPLTDIDPLTDPEQRIFLAAMGREEKVCAEADRNYVHEPYCVHEPGVDSLMSVCKAIRRKVKEALWTT